jgi:Ca2+-binding RTX toxin-like protein
VRGANDVSILRLDLAVPAGSQCLLFDFVFGSEEYPEFVGSFNDAFLAELDASTWEVTGNDVTAPANVAFGPDGNLVGVNSVFFGDATVVLETGTEYDGSTPLLTARAPITPGQHQLFLSVFDANDAILDSGAFVDNLRVASTPCQAGANDNLPPTPQDDAVTLAEDAGPTAVDVRANDTDPDGDALTITTVTVAPTHGTASCTATACTYTPAADFHGVDEFRYRVADPDGLTGIGRVSLTVTPRNDRPSAADRAVVTPFETAVDVPLGGAVADLETADADLAWTITDPEHGTVTRTGTTLRYTPDPGFSGVDSVRFSVTDRGDPDGCTGAGAGCDAARTSPEATLTVTVEPAPVGTPELGVTLEAPATAGLGADVSVAATVRNDGDGPAEDVTLAWPFGPDVVVLAAPAGCSPTTGRGVDVTCTLPDLAPGEEATTTLTVELVATCTLWGGSGADNLVGTAGKDVVCGGGGADTLLGLGGQDVLFGNAPADAGGTRTATLPAATAAAADVDPVVSAPASVRYASTDGADAIEGGTSHDYAHGGGGNDDADGGTGRDVLLGGAGRDALDGGPARGSRTAWPGDHWNRLVGGSGVDRCEPGPGARRNATDFRDASCELPTPGTGWANGSRARLDVGPAL